MAVLGRGFLHLPHLGRLALALQALRLMLGELVAFLHHLDRRISLDHSQEALPKLHLE